LPPGTNPATKEDSDFWGEAPEKFQNCKKFGHQGTKLTIEKGTDSFGRSPQKIFKFQENILHPGTNLTTKEDSDFWGEAPENFQNCKKFGHQGTNLTIEKGTDSIAVQTPKNVQISRKSASRDESDNKRRFRLLGAKPPKIF
jgi:hypothetical protein